ncbi:MAG TPA: RNA polymerase sigma factor [Streptosporangiaceae bacterium]|nr:RNA polymerase sigma factor [Streptosporangiaceae bacterium]
MDDESARERFTAVYDACRTRVWSYVAAQAGGQIADEVVSETFTVAWRRLPDMPDPPLPWLLGVARNVLRESFRAGARRDALVAELRSWTDPAGTDVAESVAERLTVLGALATLSPADREVLTLIAWHGLTMREAAKVVGSTSGALRVRLHRARRRFEQALSATQDHTVENHTHPAGRMPAITGETR